MQCRICACDVTPDAAVACARCGAPFHRDCWEFNGGCGIFGCGGTAPDAAPFTLPAEGAPLSIDETTRPPLRLAPVVESLVRRLPAWGRAHLPPTLLGGLGGLALFAGFWLASGRGERPPWVVAALMACVGAAAGFLAALVSEVQRRNPGKVAVAALAVLGLVINALYYGPYWLHEEPCRFLLLLSGCLGLIMTSTSLVELMWGALRLPTGGWRVTGFLLRCMATAAVFMGLSIATDRVARGGAMTLMDAAPGALLALGAVLPSVELSKSALLHRLKEESLRGERR